MNKAPVLSASFAILLLNSACAQLSITAPVVVLPRNGEEPLRGTVVATTDGGRFGVANSKIQCSGEYPAGSMAVAVTTKCSDGRIGSGEAVRTAPRGGRGTIRMSDGTDALFAYGTEVSTAAPAPPPQPQPPPQPPPMKHDASAAPAIGDRARQLARQSQIAAARFAECRSKAIVYLDDGHSSVEGIAEAVLGACRAELEAVCLSVRQEVGATGGCLPNETVELMRDARPKTSAEILAVRATRRMRGQPRQQPNAARPSELGT